MKTFTGWRRSLGYAYLGIVIVFLYAPIITLIILSFNSSRSMASWQGFTFDWYVEMIGDSIILDAIWNTFSIATVSALIATIIGTMGAVGISAMKKSSETIIMGFNHIPLLNADIVIGISLMLTYLLFGISLSWGTVLLSHITFALPYVILSVMPRLKQLTKTNYEAALDLGATPLYAFRKVVIPEIKPGIISGFLLAFTMSVDDFVVTHFTRGAGINTISTLIYSQTKVGIRPTLFALTSIIFILVLILLAISNIVTNKKIAEESAGL